MTETGMESPKNTAERLPVALSLALRFPRPVLWLTGLITLVLVALAAVPSIRPDLAPSLHPLRVDADPENMLPEDEPTRAFHREMKRRFALHDLLVVGVTNDSHPDGVFNQATLTNIHVLVEYARGLQWPAAEGRVRPDGVIAAEVLAPSTVDNIEPGETGSVRFAWLMPRPPANAEEARVVRDRLLRLPMLRGTLVSTDAKALTLLLPLTAKDVSYRVYGELQRKIAKLDGNESYHITGLPVAEDAFGVEMFIQMAISAPLAMLVVFLLMWLFFRRLILVTSAMLVALVSVLVTMGLLVISGHTVHIMSSMIPIFIMPIAVLDSVHILSQFFDRYGAIGGRRATIVEVVESLYKPMLYTSLTTAVGFASLALAPIPPVQVFGLFVAFGVMLAWLLTMMFIPAYVLRLNKRYLQGYASVSAASSSSLTGTFLARMGESSWRYSKPIVVLGLVALAVAVLGIGRIQVNDNPIRWFSVEHEIRAADRVLNERFGGSYMAYLALSAQEQDPLAYMDGLRDRTVLRESELNWRPGQRLVFNRLIDQMDALTWDQLPRTDVLRRLENFVQVGLGNARPEAREFWEELQLFLAEEEALAQVFKCPDVLRYLEGLQNHMHTLGAVGNTNSLADVVKTVYRELIGGAEEALRIPASRRAVGQTLLVYQNSHRPDDLWHFVTPDYRQASLWVQLKSGDNQDMSRVVAAVEDYMGRNPPPMGLEPRWFGLSYINLVW